MNSRNEISFNIVERIGVIAEYKTGWVKELNRISWNDGPAKYDIREWDPEHEHMSRGITLTEEEMGNLKEMMNARDMVKQKEKKSKDWER